MNLRYLRQASKRMWSVKTLITLPSILLLGEYFSNLQQSFSFLAGNESAAYELYHSVTEATKVLEYFKFNICAATAGGAPPNFLKWLQKMYLRSFFGQNSFDITRKIYFTVDVPGLLKTTRSFSENSHGSNNTHHLHVNFIDIKK